MAVGDKPTRIAIVTDASADAPLTERHGDNWHVVADHWKTHAVDIVDTGESSRELTRLVLSDNSLICVTPSTEDFSHAYARACASADRVYSLHSAATISPAVSAAREAAADYDKVVIVETSVSGIGVGLLAAQVLRLASDGRSINRIDEFVERYYRNIHLMLVPDHFDPLGRQRMSAAVLLSGRPLFRAHDGPLTSGRRLRTRRATLSATAKHFRENAPHDRAIHVAIGHADAAGAVDPLLDLIERIRPTAHVEFIGRIGPHLLKRVGSRCVGISWIVE